MMNDEIVNDKIVNLTRPVSVLAPDSVTKQTSPTTKKVGTPTKTVRVPT